MIEIIKDKKTWCDQLALFNTLDFYHTFDYHMLSKKADESPILIKYSDGNTILMLPLLIRDIEHSEYRDAVSVYGYSGILSLNPGEIKKENFTKELNSFFKEHKIVSVFSRLHPFLENQEILLDGLGTITSPGKVVYIDLTDSIENQRAKFNRRLKTYLNKSRKACTVFEGDNDVHVRTFINLYHENMKRVDAEDSYFFDDDYFFQLLSSDQFDSKLFLCSNNDTQEIMGGAIFIKKGNIVQYHLSGLAAEDFDVDPIKLIIDEMRIQSTKEGYEVLNLGGGRGSNDDSLFRFKSGFSKDFKDFKVWKYIVDADAYKILVERKLGNNTSVDEIAYFPAYRAS